QNFDLRSIPVRALIHAGEPGANVAQTKARIEVAWHAKCFDHAGASEVGAHSFECELQPKGIHVIESEFIPEVIDPQTGKEVQPGETDRKSTRLNSSHVSISYAVFCLKKKKF